jgi:hypothetical protein
MACSSAFSSAKEEPKCKGKRGVGPAPLELARVLLSNRLEPFLLARNQLLRGGAQRFPGKPQRPEPLPRGRLTRS